MRIGTRITLTTSLLVAITLGVYTVVTLRAMRSNRQEELAHQARELATAVRATIETRGLAEYLASTYELERAFDQTGIPWSLQLLDARDAPPPNAPPTGDPRRERLRRMMAIRAPILEEATEGGRPVPGIIVGRDLARQLNIRIGDRVRARFRTGAEATRTSLDLYFELI